MRLDELESSATFTRPLRTSAIMVVREAARSDRLSHHPPETAKSARTLDSSTGASRHVALRVIDGFAFSSGLAASVGGALSMVVSRLLEAPHPGSWAGLTGCGAFIIYNLDRLRDVERDGLTSPRRTEFVSRHRRLLYVAIGIACVAFAAILWTEPLSATLLCAAIGSVGFLHRRLKHVAILKTVYVSLAWVSACVGLPWLASEQVGLAPWIGIILFGCLSSNLIASNLRDDEVTFVRMSSRSVVRVARWIVLIAIGATLLAPTPLRPLVWIPICEGVALAAYRPTERYGHLAVDGALLVGALAASIQIAWATVSAA
jgi:hypothetical protein